MSNFILYLLMFALGAFWMKVKCQKIYNSEIWKAKTERELAKIRLQTQRLRAKEDSLLNDRISGKKANHAEG
jgi:hypothetical protein